MTYPADEDECADKLYASIPHISDGFVLDEDSQKCITGGSGRDACTVSIEHSGNSNSTLIVTFVTTMETKFKVEFVMPMTIVNHMKELLISQMIDFTLSRGLYKTVKRTKV